MTMEEKVELIKQHPDYPEAAEAFAKIAADPEKRKAFSAACGIPERYLFGGPFSGKMESST